MRVVARVWTMALLAPGLLAAGRVTAPAGAQSAAAPAAAAAQHAVGTVKSASATGLTLTTTAGQEVTVTVPAGVKVLVVPPGSKDLNSATEGTLSDMTPGDRALVTGAAGADGTLTAERVIVMKAQAIAATHAADAAAWAKGGGGIVKSVDAAAGRIEIASGLRTVTVVVTPATVVRHYAGNSVAFADAKPSTIGEIRKGDQLRVRGARSADGSTITADELVAGTFEHYSGLISALDAAAGTVTLKDLATKKAVTVAVSSSSDVRRIPALLAERVAAGVRGGGAGAAGRESGAAGGEHAGGEHAGGGEDGAARGGRAGMDLSQMLPRLPTETLAGLKVGDAVMIVATSPTDGAETPAAVTLLAGVDAILRASPSGQTLTLSPWSLGGGGEDTGEGGGGGAPGGGPQRAASPQ